MLADPFVDEGKRRRSTTIIAARTDESLSTASVVGEDAIRRREAVEFDYVNRSAQAIVYTLHPYRYRLDGYYTERSIEGTAAEQKTMNEEENEEEEIRGYIHPQSSTTSPIPYKPPSSTNSSPIMTPRTDPRSMSDDRGSSSSKSSITWAMKPRTVKQQKNKKRHKELNERWRCVSENGGPPTIEDTSSTMIIPMIYDERAIDCEGLSEEREPRFRPLSQIFTKKTSINNNAFSPPHDLNSAISELDLARWAGFSQYTNSSPPDSRQRVVSKAKSQMDLSSTIAKNQVVIMGRNIVKTPKFSTSTEDFRKQFVQGLWTQNDSAEMRVSPTRTPKVDGATIRDSRFEEGKQDSKLCDKSIRTAKSINKNIDSGYDSPEMTLKTSASDGGASVPKEQADDGVYVRFDSRKASLFNEYFQNSTVTDPTNRPTSLAEARRPSKPPTVGHSLARFTDRSPVQSTPKLDQSPPQSSERPVKPPAVPPRNRLSSQGPEIERRQSRDTPKSSLDRYSVLIAIDFGTSQSGFAYSFPTGGGERVHFMRRMSNGGLASSSGVKCPTCLLLDPDGRFHSYGWEARDSYGDLEPDDAQRWFYFESIKMVLTKEKALRRDTTIAAANGVHWPLVDVMAHSLWYLKQRALAESSEHVGSMIDSSRVRWVIAAPAIWRQSAKQLLRTAAYQAGLASPENFDQLLVALESESASIYCASLTRDDATVVPRSDLATPPAYYSLPSSFGKDNRRQSNDPRGAPILQPGDAYIVADCGGGKIEIAAHQLMENGDIVELRKAEGGPRGSAEIDQAFESLLRDIFGAEVIDEFRQRYPGGYLGLMRSFDARKCSAYPRKLAASYNVVLPFTFLEFYKKKFGHRVECAVKRYEKNKHVGWNSQGMLRLSSDLMSMLFMPTLVALTKSIDDIIESVQSTEQVSHLFLVGGFAESPLLQQEVRNVFENRLNIVFPNESTSSVLRGALLFGSNPRRIVSRRSRQTYGISVLHPFDPQTHPPEKRVSKNGRDWCKDVFEKFITLDEPIEFDRQLIRHYCPASSDQAEILIQIFSTHTSTDPKFVTDSDVERCGVLKIDLAPTGENKTKRTEVGNREIKTSLKFGRTELILEAIDVFSGKPAKACIDFLT